MQIGCLEQPLPLEVVRLVLLMAMRDDVYECTSAVSARVRINSQPNIATYVQDVRHTDFAGVKAGLCKAEHQQ
jgi:hypothetical protein